MKTVHIGHHFYGAGNFGDDLMLAGFLEAARGRSDLTFTCCVPHPLEPLRGRFPQVAWLPHDPSARKSAVARCDVWLGLGGTPFQCAVSSWFLTHWEEERRLCADAGKPMFLLGVGGQDDDAYRSAEARAIVERAESIWTRDDLTATAVAALGGGSRVHAAADLAHICLERHRPPAARPGRLSVVFNFDGEAPASFPAFLAACDRPDARERCWVAQETRPLPGGEQQLFGRLTPHERARWIFQLVDRGAGSAADVLAHWPSGEWTVVSRYHASIIGAWGGSRGVIVRTNRKLEAAGDALGWPQLPPDATPHEVGDAWARSRPVDAPGLTALAEKARQACEAFFQAI